MKAPVIATEENPTIDEAIKEYKELGDHLGKDAPQFGWMPNIVDNLEHRRRFLSEIIVEYCINERTHDD